jgi:hypothetical protein
MDVDEAQRKVRLRPEHFSVNDRGEVVIKNAEIAELVKDTTASVKDPEAAGVEVGVTVSVSI